jgi:hypothetical protein
MGPVDSRVFLILPSETTAPSKGALLFSGRNTAGRPFFASPSGNYAFYSFDGELHAVDVRTQTDLRMDASYRYTMRR